MDSKAELTLILKARNLASREVDRLGNSLDRTANRKGFGNIVKGIGVGAGIAAFNLLSVAIGGVTSVMGDAIQGALDEEASIAKLNTSLKANVKGFNGNTDAIETLLTARMKLGFSDDEQRDSLARVVVATGDVSRALDIQRTAMDLARLKGIDLATASDALIRIEGGQFRALKALGIELPKNATQTEALAAVQRAAAGQAEAYAKTNQGKLLVSQVKVGEAMEKLGTVLLPVVATVLGFVADAVEALSIWFTKSLVPALAQAGKGWDKLMKFIQPVIDAIRWIIDNAGKALDALANIKITPIGGGGPTGAQAVHPQGHWSGGWAGLNGPELGWLGERGPEYITPNHELGSMGQTINNYLVVDGKQLALAVAPAVSKAMFRELQRSAPTLSRT